MKKKTFNRMSYTSFITSTVMIIFIIIKLGSLSFREETELLLLDKIALGLFPVSIILGIFGCIKRIK